MVMPIRKRLLGTALTFVWTVHAFAATNDVVTLPEVVVWGDRKVVRTVRASDEVWRGLPTSLSARGQGEAGTITDLSVNGSAFSEAGVVFNGATVRNAQTEHFNVDLPVAAERPRWASVLTGLSSDA